MWGDISEETYIYTLLGPSLLGPVRVLTDEARHNQRVLSKEIYIHAKTYHTEIHMHAKTYHIRPIQRELYIRKSISKETNVHMKRKLKHISNGLTIWQSWSHEWHLYTYIYIYLPDCCEVSFMRSTYIYTHTHIYIYKWIYEYIYIHIYIYIYRIVVRCQSWDISWQTPYNNPVNIYVYMYIDVFSHDWHLTTIR